MKLISGLVGNWKVLDRDDVFDSTPTEKKKKKKRKRKSNNDFR